MIEFQKKIMLSMLFFGDKVVHRKANKNLRRMNNEKENG